MDAGEKNENEKGVEEMRIFKEKSPLIKCRDDVADDFVKEINKMLKELDMSKLVYTMKPSGVIYIITETIEDRKYKIENRTWESFVNEQPHGSNKEGAWLKPKITLNNTYGEGEVLDILKAYNGKLSTKAKSFLYKHDATCFSYKTRYCSICKKKTLHICHYVTPDRHTLGGNSCQCLNCIHQILKKKNKKKEC